MDRSHFHTWKDPKTRFRCIIVAVLSFVCVCVHAVIPSLYINLPSLLFALPILLSLVAFSSFPSFSRYGTGNSDLKEQKKNAVREAPSEDIEVRVVVRYPPTSAMLDSLRLFVLSVLYYFGFTYAAFTALAQRVTSEEVVEVSGQGPQQQTKVLIGTPALKLMIMLTATALLSFIGAEWFPLFAEMRVIFMYTLLFSPPFTQQEIYDQVFAPLLERGGALSLSLQTSNFLSRKVPLFVVRRCVDGGIAAMNFAQRHHALEEDAVRDILSGLVFSRRALQQVAELSREVDGATYAAIARESNFAMGIFTSRVKRALLNNADTEEEEEEHGVVRPPTALPAQTRRVPLEDAWFSRDTPLDTVSALSAASVAALGSSGGSEGLVESIHSERDFQASGRESRKGDGSRRDKRKKHRIFGLF